MISAKQLLVFVLALLQSSVSIGEIRLSVTSDIIRDKINEELSKRRTPIYVRSNDGLLRLNGQIQHCFSVSKIQPIKCESAAIGRVHFSGDLSFRSLRVQFGLLERRVTGRLAVNGSAIINATDNHLMIDDVQFWPTVRCITADSPFLRHILQKGSVQRSISRVSSNRARHFLASYSTQIDAKYKEFAKTVKSRLRSIPMLEDTFSLESGDSVASVVMKSARVHVTPPPQLRAAAHTLDQNQPSPFQLHPRHTPQEDSRTENPRLD